MRRKTQINRMEMMHTGSATKNQTPQDGSGCMFCSAIRFWGEAMGDAAPPMLEERAMPMRSALVMSESAGRLRRMGCDVSWMRMFWKVLAYLDDREAQHGRGNVADPHTGKHGDEHVDHEDGPWLRSGLAKDKGSHHLGDVVL